MLRPLTWYLDMARLTMRADAQPAVGEQVVQHTAADGADFPLADRNWHAGDATTWPPTARSRTSPCTTERVTSRRCTSAPIPARSRSTRRCPTPGPAAGRDGLMTGAAGAPCPPHTGPPIHLDPPSHTKPRRPPDRA